MPLVPERRAVLVDTGVLVAVFNRLDPQHSAAAAWLARNTAPLLTVEPVLSETAFFLPARLRAALATLAAKRVLQVHDVDDAGHARMAELFDKYADQDPDWADLALVWLAETAGVHCIATLDMAGFSVYRIKGRKRFEMALLA